MLDYRFLLSCRACSGQPTSQWHQHKKKTGRDTVYHHARAITACNMAQSIDSKRTFSKSAHPRVLHKTSEFILVVYYFAVWILQHFVPLPFKSHPLHALRPITRICLGWLLGIAGVILIGWLRIEMKRYSQPTQPGKLTTRLIRTGPFRYSRNPTYLAFVAFVVPGSGFLFPNILYIWLLWPLLVVAFYGVLIRDEEEYLNRLFGVQWRNYCHQTHRWI